MPSPESSSSSSSDFNEQRAAELRCEIAELRDVVQSQKAELDTKKNGSTRFRADMTRVKRELADLRKVSDDAIRQRSLSDTERERLTNELEEARKRYRQKGRVMKTKIDNQAASIETLQAKCTTLNNVRIQAERTASQSENQRESAKTKMKLLEDSLTVTTRERGKEEKKEALFSMLYMLFGNVLLSVVDERSVILNRMEVKTDFITLFCCFSHCCLLFNFSSSSSPKKKKMIYETKSTANVKSAKSCDRK